MQSDLEEFATMLLAAGQSRRFGAGNKLLSPFDGRPLVQHAAMKLAQIPFGIHMAVTTGGVARHLPSQFKPIPNHHPELGISHSISLGIGAIMQSHARACLVALADMPLVPNEHFWHLLEHSRENPDAVIATNRGNGAGDRLQVPAIFPRRYFADLQNLKGDIGARQLIKNAIGVECDAHLLADFDRPTDFTRPVP